VSKLAYKEVEMVERLTHRDTVKISPPLLPKPSLHDVNDVSLTGSSKARRWDGGLCLAGVVVVAGLVGLVSLYYSEVLEHHITLGSCARPAVELLASLWSVALVSLACASHGRHIILTNISRIVFVFLIFFFTTTSPLPRSLPRPCPPCHHHYHHHLEICN
jgi:hypothetical protein